MTDGIDPGRNRIVVALCVITVVAAIGIAMAALICAVVPERDSSLPRFVPTEVRQCHFSVNGSAYSLVYRPDGDEATVWIEPMVKSAGLDAAAWVARAGVVQAAPVEPVVFNGTADDGYRRFRVSVERDTGIETTYIDTPAHTGAGSIP